MTAALAIPAAAPALPQAVSFRIPGPPSGKGRPRATQRGVVYTPAATRAAESFIRQIAALAMRGREKFDGPVTLTLTISFAVPASWSKRDRAKALAGALRPRSLDIDNIAKLVCDGMNGIVWVDDRQVWRLLAQKRYHAEPGIDVTVTALEGAK